MSGKLGDPAALAVGIDEFETIIRVVVAPAHYDYKKSRVKTAVFRPPPSRASVSVMRQAMGDNFCKAKAIEIGQKSNGQTNVGMLTITAAQIRANCSQVTDSRELWLGHADLEHGLPSPPPNDPGSAADFERMTRRCKALLDASVFRTDGDPGKEEWMSESLQLACAMGAGTKTT